jgi:deoxycytidylate deaminase
MSISLGASGNKVPYSFTVDTGSGVLLATCRTENSLANCANALPVKQNYLLSPAATVSDKATCDSTGVGCILLPSNNCCLSEEVSNAHVLYGSPLYSAHVQA